MHDDKVRKSMEGPDLKQGSSHIGQRFQNPSLLVDNSRQMQYLAWNYCPFNQKLPLSVSVYWRNSYVTTKELPLSIKSSFHRLVNPPLSRRLSERERRTKRSSQMFYISYSRLLGDSTVKSKIHSRNECPQHESISSQRWVALGEHNIDHFLLLNPEPLSPLNISLYDHSSLSFLLACCVFPWLASFAFHSTLPTP